MTHIPMAAKPYSICVQSSGIYISTESGTVLRYGLEANPAGIVTVNILNPVQLQVTKNGK
jgi:hypothetical protein